MELQLLGEPAGELTLTLNTTSLLLDEKASGILVGRDQVSSLCVLESRSKSGVASLVARQHVLPGRYWLVTHAGFATAIEVSPGSTSTHVQLGEALLVVRSSLGGRVQVVPDAADPFLRLVAARMQIRIKKGGETSFLLGPGSYRIVGEAGRALLKVEVPPGGTVVELDEH